MSNRSRSLIGAAERVGALLLAATLVACGPAPDPGTVRFGLATPPATLDPRFATDASAARLCRLVYAALVDFDARFTPVPALATWVEVSPRLYRFTLRAARFHDGAPVTAGDVVATYRALLDPARASPLRGALAHVVSVEARDPRTVDFHLARPDPLFPGLLTQGILRAADAGLAVLPSRPVGSGPFRVIAPPDGRRIALARVADGQRVDFVIVPNETTRALKLARGELDLLQGGFAPELGDWLAARPDLTVMARPGTVFTYLGFNLASGPTTDPRVRAAIAHAIDRAALIRYVFRDRARPAATLLVPEHWASDPRLAGPAHAPARARALLADAGFSPARPLRLRYKTSNDPFRRRIATILQDQLKTVGIDLVIESHDWGTFYGDVRDGRFELYALSWVGLQLPDIFRHAFHSTSVPPRGANRGRYANPRVDRLIERAEIAADPTARTRLYHALQAQLLADLPYVPLWYEDTFVAYGPRVRGYTVDLHGQFDGLRDLRRVEVPGNASILARNDGEEP